MGLVRFFETRRESGLMYNDNTYDIFDECYGFVTRTYQNGVQVRLDNGKPAYAHRFANLALGTRVLCSVRRLATEDRDMLVSIDSVIFHGQAA